MTAPLSLGARLALIRLAGREPDPLDLYDPTIAMAEVHRSQAVWRFLRKPNQVGGTYSMGAEVWWAALGLHPWRPPIHPEAPLWVLLTDLEGEYRTVCEKLWETAPRSRLAKGCQYVPSKGFTYRGSNLLVLDNGRRVEFKSGTQNVGALESGTVGAAFINEPPSPDHLSALMQRCAVHSAPVLMNFTPVGRPLKWLRALVEGDEETGEPPQMPGWEIHLPVLDEASCTTLSGRVIRSRESIASQVASMTPWQRRQRQYGDWEGESADRRFVHFSEAQVIQEAQVPDAFREFRVGLDHGEGDRKQIGVLIGVYGPVTAPKFLVLEEFIAPKASPPGVVAAGILRMLSERGLAPQRVTRWYGDINSAGLLGAGRRYNDFVADAIFAEVRWRPTIETPDKRAGSVAAGEAALHTAMAADRFAIVAGCRSMIRAVRHYQGPSDPEHKDEVDAMRYGLSDLLLRTWRQPALVVRG